MDDSSEQNSSTQSRQTPFNFVSLAMILSVGLFGYWGYHSELFPDSWGQLPGIVLGIIVSFLATPIVFVLLILVVHGLIKLEDFFKREK